MCRTGRNAPHNSPDCVNGIAVAPVVQNRFGGVRTCGVRNSPALVEQTRPVAVDPAKNKGREFACPLGTFTCNESFFDEPKGEEFVVCLNVTQAGTNECPITDLVFEVSEAEKSYYEWRGLDRTATGFDPSIGVWISRKRMRSALNYVTV